MAQEGVRDDLVEALVPPAPSSPSAPPETSAAADPADTTTTSVEASKEPPSPAIPADPTAPVTEAAAPPKPEEEDGPLTSEEQHYLPEISKEYSPRDAVLEFILADADFIGLKYRTERNLCVSLSPVLS